MRPFTALLLALATAGCFTWHPYQPAAPLEQKPDLPYRLRAILADTTRVHLVSPFIRADTLYGRTVRQDTVGFALADIQGLESEHFSVWRTLGLTVGAPAVALVTIFAVACGGSDDCGPQPVN